MVKRITVTGLLLGSLLALVLQAGCGPSTDLTGSPIPNALPDTRVTARPPDVIEAGFVVQFYWTASDPDGRIDKYQWRISNNGTDGISVQDTLTFDPVTGDTLNPWFDTLSSDSTFLVSADIPDFPGDPEGFNRSYQTHSFWVRAVDEDGGIDPSPASVSFTSTTLLPTVTLDGPTSVVGQIEASALPKTVTFLFDGIDPDFDVGLPTKVRYLWKRAILPNGDYADTRNDFRANMDYLVSFDDSAWTEWKAYDTNDETRRITLPDRQQTDANGNNIYYLFALQAQDTAGAESIDRIYGQQVANVRITDALAPQLRVLEQFLGEFAGAGPNLVRSLDIAAGQELNFSWTASASGYAGEIVSFRYGWDVSDVSDPNDPGWALLPGNSAQHRRSPTISFPSNVHTLTIQVTDNSNQLTQIQINLSVVPVPAPEDQLPVLLVDDVKDQDSNKWPDPNGAPLDRDFHRDAFWESTLQAVANFNPVFHTIDTEDEQVEYRDVVGYRTLAWAGRWVSGNNSAVGQQFRPGRNAQGDVDQYIWLTPYQENVGNVLYASNRGMNAFLAESAYELPIVFESREGNVTTGNETVNGITVRRAFGTRTLPDGTTVQVGLTRYPYATMGIAALDIMSVNAAYYEYNTGALVSRRRKASCVGMKGLVLDSVFKANYLPGGSVFADTILTDSVIDWYDDPYTPVTPQNQEPLDDVLALTYTWGNDEFYDRDIVARNSQITIQQCDGVDCVEPMFRSWTRFDWIRANRLWDDPESTWPLGYYDEPPTLDDYCGPKSLQSDRNSAITNNLVVGFVARKTAPDKPSQVGDVNWGFDPYRFDNAEMSKAILWVLGNHFGLTVTE